MIGKAIQNRLAQEAKRAESKNNAHAYKRAMVLLCYAQEVPIEEICSIFRICERTIYNWLKEFIVKRFGCFIGIFKGRGRKPRLSKEQRARLKEIIIKGPEKYGLKTGIWVSSTIQWVIQEQFNVFYAVKYIPELLKQMGLSWQKAKFVSDHFDEQKRKVWQEQTWPAILKQAKQLGAVILFGDEASFAQWGSLSYTWGLKGKQPVSKTSGKRKALKVFGVIEFFSGKFIHQEHEGKFNSQSYEQFLEYVLPHFACPVILIQDGATYHTSAAMNEYFEKKKQEGRLFCYQLPSYSPDYNPIEKLWKQTKADKTHLRYFPQFSDLKAAVMEAFEDYMRNVWRVIAKMESLRERSFKILEACSAKILEACSAFC
jgi:transposase